MPYETQPGTVPHRAIAWLRAMHPNGTEVTSAVICDELGIDRNGFSSSMKPAKAAGLVKARKIEGEGKALFWSLGDGEPEQAQAEHDEEEPFAGKERAQVVVRPGPLFPGVTADGNCTVREFRALWWEGKLLATGMEIRDGVAIFTQQQFEQLAWAKATE